MGVNYVRETNQTVLLYKWEKLGDYVRVRDASKSRYKYDVWAIMQNNRIRKEREKILLKRVGASTRK